MPARTPTEPCFVADPNHRGNILTGELIRLDTSLVENKLTMTRMDSTRIGKNFGYMARRLPEKDQSEFAKLGHAALDHHFDTHDNCGDWCRRKHEKQDQRKQSRKHYRSIQRKDDEKLCHHLLSIPDPKFISTKRLKELAHGMDANANEAFNNVATWYAPKNKVHCGSKSLRNRLGIAIGVTSLGIEKCHTRLFNALGIEVTANIRHFLQVRDKVRLNKLSFKKTMKCKKRRNKRKCAKLVEDTRIARKERLRRDGKYRTRMNLDGYSSDEREQQSATKKKCKRTNAATRLCPHPFCGKKGHSTTRSEHCLANPKRLEEEGLTDACAAAVAAANVSVQRPANQTDNQDAEDVDAHDAMPFNASLPDSEISDYNLHENADTWSEDEDGNVIRAKL